MDRRVSVEHLDLFLSDDTLEDGVTQVTKSVRPEWPELDVKLKVFTDGITNRLIGVYLDDSPNDMVLIRVYGQKTELFIDRRQEVRNMRTMHKSGLVPAVYCTFNNGICYGYSPGIVLNEDLVRDPLISRLISEMMARMHTIKPQTNRSLDHKECVLEAEPCLFKGLRKFLDLIPSALKDSQLDQRFKRFVPKKETLVSEVNWLESCLKKLCSPVVFCHNDLLLKNIVFNSDKSCVNFIDFEYSDYNYQAFDIANHFCEFAGVDTFNPSLYPDKEFQLRWLRHYLETWLALKGRSHSVANAIERPSLDKEVDALFYQVNKFSMAPHLFWGLWAVVQSEHSTINFDFLGYAIERIDEYYKRKEELTDEVFN